MIMLMAPYGVFALLGALVVDFGASADLFCCIGHVFFGCGWRFVTDDFSDISFGIALFTKVKYLDFFKAISPAQMLAFSTSSSAATLPVTMERCEEHLGVSEEVSSFVLPLVLPSIGWHFFVSGSGSRIYRPSFRLWLDLAAQLTRGLTATLASIGAAGCSRRRVWQCL